ncbi:MAG: ATPase, T2SS/T4P/T4SS family [Pseudomonadota bacterium]
MSKHKMAVTYTRSSDVVSSGDGASAAPAGGTGDSLRPRHRLIGEMLVERGLISEDDLKKALQIQGEVGGPVGQALVRIGALSEEKLLDVLSEQLGLPVIGRAELPSAADVRAAAERTGTRVAWWLDRHAVIWFMEVNGVERLLCASAHPLHADLQGCADQLHDAPMAFFLASRQSLEHVTGELTASNVDDALAFGDDDARRLRELAEEGPAIDFVNAVFAEALARRASDVHIEPFEESFVVRMRVDGVMTLWRTASRSNFDAVASRVKLLSGMNIAERRLPQDGRQSIRVSGREVDLRVSTLPTSWGESVVLRLLGKTTSLPELEELGVLADQRDMLTELVGMPNGVLLITGPTGSGKTTTIYRLIRHLSGGARKIITVEDPVEFDLPGVNQVPVKSEIGLSFAAGLRSILRQDPDVIMVGEIRDPETAQIAVQAALTGHLVISTLHTNSSLAAIPRLLDLGVEEFLLADVLRGLAAQRLVRTPCEHCAISQPPPKETIAPAARTAAVKKIAALGEDASPKWRAAIGCDHCGGSGYRGRLGLYEVAAVDEPLRAAIRERRPETELLAIARENGFRTMNEDGVMKAHLGLTTIEEVHRVVSA